MRPFETIMLIPLISISALLWAGMILGISFLESWVKFRAPLLTKAAGLDVGRTVFSYFHKVQALWLACVWYLCILAQSSWSSWLIVGALTTILILQISWLFPLLKQQVSVIISGGRSSDSYVHTLYGIGELTKFLLLLGLSINIP